MGLALIKQSGAREVRGWMWVMAAAIVVLNLYDASTYPKVTATAEDL